MYEILMSALAAGLIIGGILGFFFLMVPVVIVLERWADWCRGR